MSDQLLNKLNKEIEQLKIRKDGSNIIRVSEACADLKEYVLSQDTNDPMLAQYSGENIWLAQGDNCCTIL